MKLIIDNGYKNCQLDFNMGNEMDFWIIIMMGCFYICLENILDLYCCDGYYGFNCLGKFESLILMKFIYKFLKIWFVLGFVF